MQQVDVHAIVGRSRFIRCHGRVLFWCGACTLGHPIGASGARILVTLIGALRRPCSFGGSSAALPACASAAVKPLRWPSS